MTRDVQTVIYLRDRKQALLCEQPQTWQGQEALAQTLAELDAQIAIVQQRAEILKVIHIAPMGERI